VVVFAGVNKASYLVDGLSNTPQGYLLISEESSIGFLNYVAVKSLREDSDK